MATPHEAGVAALYLEPNPGAVPAEAASTITLSATGATYSLTVRIVTPTWSGATSTDVDV